LNKKKLLVIIGPTAVGKTELSLRLAERLDGEIVSADSRYFYRGMSVGTAKPSAAEMARVRHHLVDVADPDQTWSLAVFQQAAREAITDIHARGKLPVLVGGTGQYVRAVTEGWTPPEVAPDARLREVLEKMASERGEGGIYWLHAKLAMLDPDAAAKIDPRNLRRTVRALEVVLSTGRLFSRQAGKSESAYELLTVGLNRPRAELYQRIDQRIDLMFQSGFLEEVARLYEKGYGPELPSMSAIGYREAGAVLRGEMSVEEAKIQMRRLTRMYVRRQANWFKPDDPQIRWFEAGQVSLEEIQVWVVGQLASLRGV
jgi:tRNA dimethylallyltransferase